MSGEKRPRESHPRDAVFFADIRGYKKRLLFEDKESAGSKVEETDLVTFSSEGMDDYPVIRKLLEDFDWPRGKEDDHGDVDRVAFDAIAISEKELDEWHSLKKEIISMENKLACVMDRRLKRFHQRVDLVIEYGFPEDTDGHFCFDDVLPVPGNTTDAELADAIRIMVREHLGGTQEMRVYVIDDG